MDLSIDFAVLRKRAEPIGHDQQRNAYWFIGGTSLVPLQFRNRPHRLHL